MFKVIKKSKKSQARLTRLTTTHGTIRGPFFMPIATRGAVKNLSNEELAALGAEMILSNTYHLLLRPGTVLLKRAGGLHGFMDWPKPILTDSGGFQVFSLGAHRKITEAGGHFSDPLNGNRYFLSPERVIEIQRAIGSDIAMTLDECPAYPCTRAYAKTSLELTSRWAQRCKTAHRRQKTKQLLFGIVQGSVYKQLRLQSAKQLTAIGFDGYAIGGVAVGEPRKKMAQVLDWMVPELPADKPRYLMGVGRPEEIVAAVKQGIDMFDCVIPTREARHGRLYIWNYSKQGRREPLLSPRSEQRLRPTPLLKGKFYKTINITRARYAKDFSPINNSNLKRYSKAYLHHLFKTNEPLGMRLATLNNLNFYLSLMVEIRKAIKTLRL